MTDLTGVTRPELIRLCAVDSELFCKVFFPKAFRQDSPGFARAFWEPLDNPDIHYINYLMFRGSSKTTRLRAFIAKRFAYASSRTVLFTAASEGKVASSIRWLKRAIEYNPLFASTYQLRKGAKWTDTEIEVIHGIEEVPMNLIGMGIGGPIRGINFDDWRPDLIVMDDILNEDNASTSDGRDKIKSLVYGALMNGLAPVSEAPDCKMVSLQTPMNRDDYASLAENDDSWHTVKVSCWTPESADLPIDRQESSWSARWTSAELREKKRAAIKRNQLSIWTREMEVRNSSPELAVFVPEWKKTWAQLRKPMTHVLVVDPVPPPSDLAVKKGKIKTDFEAMAIIGAGAGDFFVRELSIMRGHDPSWSIAEFFRLAHKYAIQKAIVETVGYQRTLKWLFQTEMQKKRLYYRIDDFTDQRSKYQRIVDCLNGPASMGRVYWPPEDSIEGRSEGILMAKQQFDEYPNVQHDDALEVVAIGVGSFAGFLSTQDDGVANDDAEDEYKPLKFAPGALAP